jgi:hypothetical protein
METYSQRPGRFNLEFRAGDDFAVTLDFSIALTGYSLVAAIYSEVSGALVLPLTVSIANAADGIAVVSLTDAQTAALARGTYRWSVVGTVGENTRTLFQGFVEVLS